MGCIYLGGSQDAIWRVNEGYSLAFAGVCDGDCRDMDLVSAGRRGFSKQGTYTVHATTPKCKCAYRMLLGGAGAVEASGFVFPCPTRVQSAPKLETLVKNVRR